MAVVHIGEQAGLCGFPAEGSARDAAGRREVQGVTHTVRAESCGIISSSAGMLTAGRPRRLPIASAITERDVIVLKRMPELACRTIPAPGGTRKRHRGRARHPTRFSPSPGSPAKPSPSRADERREDPASVVLCMMGGIRTTEDRTPWSARPTTAASTTLRARKVPLCSSPTGGAESSSVAGRPRFPPFPAEPCSPPRPAAFRFPPMPHRRRA